MKEILFVSRLDKRNPGDMSSSPSNYFGFEGCKLSSCDIRRIPISDLQSFDAIIVGGGGLLDLHYFLPCLEELMSVAECPVVFWGLGMNRIYSDQPIEYPVQAKAIWDGSFLKFFWNRYVTPPKLTQRQMNLLNSASLVGIRDDITQFAWVPCSSCMLPDLDPMLRVEPCCDLVVLEHPDFFRIRKQFDDLSVMCSQNIGQSIPELLHTLAKGAVVITSSYHAAFWAKLIGREAIVFDWGQKFRHMKPKPQLIDLWSNIREQDVQKLIDRSLLNRSYALQEARSATLNFAEHVSGTLGIDVNSSYKPPGTNRH